MHPYLITAKPGRIRRTAVWVRVCVLRILALTVMTVLGAVVLTVRCARPVINYLATRAAWLELWASQHTGLPPFGAAVGSGLTDEFVNEFHRNRRTATAGSPR
ncbi:hypothetical protein ABZ438_07960 [Streptomyces sp. NPDC005786]|uniref:hypothetical protein n=1 Tax=Streptomyces sp. NPDC005786 TaxID=3154891 RepID=UPI0033D709BE